MQSRHGILGIVRRLTAGQGAATGGIAASIRQISSAMTSQHVQMAPSYDNQQSEIDVKPRWQRELGAIRTDWT